MTESAQPPPRVFLSYSHDSPEHKDKVLDLSDRLRLDGIDCRLDQYEQAPPEGWPRWTRKQVVEADFVLVVCTETYERRFNGTEEPGKGRGVKWEGAILTQELYEAEAQNKKFIPVVFSGEDRPFVPVELRGATYYDVTSKTDFEELYRRLTDQPSTLKPDLGKLRSLPQKERQGEPSSVGFSKAQLSITCGNQANVYQRFEKNAKVHVWYIKIKNESLQVK